ncbi:MAG: caspase family protein [Armatimonadetes bacterium]|nr:caspase family protein [Armatimonadota bacterium]
MLTAFLACTLKPEVPTPRTWLFGVACTTFKDRRFHNLPAEGRAMALPESLERTGVPRSRIVWLRDRDAETRRVDFEFKEMLGRVKPGDTLVVFYSGHGYFQDGKPQLATYNAEVASSGWRIERVSSWLSKAFKGSCLVVAIDCCASGSMLPWFQNQRFPVTFLASAKGDAQAPEGWSFQELLGASVARHGQDWAAVRRDMDDGWNGQTWSGG